MYIIHIYIYIKYCKYYIWSNIELYTDKPWRSMKTRGMSYTKCIEHRTAAPCQVAILSLGSPCLFSFYPRSGTEASGGSPGKAGRGAWGSNGLTVGCESEKRQDCMKWDPANDVPGGFEVLGFGWPNIRSLVWVSSLWSIQNPYNQYHPICNIGDIHGYSIYIYIHI